jgi:hypothetical protein
MGVWGLLSTVQMCSPPVGRSLSFEPSRLEGILGSQLAELVPKEELNQDEDALHVVADCNVPPRVLIVDGHAWAYHIFQVVAVPLFPWHQVLLYLYIDPDS